MTHLETGLKIGVVYWVHFGTVHKRLRVKINNRAYHCGKTIKNTNLSLTYICGDGEIILKENTGKEFKIKTKVLKNNTDK